jgi:hypothetical protein
MYKNSPPNQARPQARSSTNCRNVSSRYWMNRQRRNPNRRHRSRRSPRPRGAAPDVSAYCSDEICPEWGPDRRCVAKHARRRLVDIRQTLPGVLVRKITRQPASKQLRTASFTGSGSEYKSSVNTPRFSMYYAKSINYRRIAGETRSLG